ncbi:hypothetical protein [Ligilactobacillus salivarius]|uniref:hypothetical protein n=1 Tax=Ligilactobacillus salivarius TaxID=1624 RepID=UPI0026717E74|nr:hypothetical protein [Ligilactobacillus salivarius]
MVQKTSEAQLKANRRWKNKNRDKQRNYQYGSYARKFIREIANEKQLNELEILIKERKNLLK